MQNISKAIVAPSIYMPSSDGHVDVVVGILYGDEGKGKKIDERVDTGEYGIVDRYNGANNAGHSLILENGEVLILNSLPSGVRHKNIINYIGSGCVVDPIHLVKREIPLVESKVEIGKLDGRLKISSCCSLITPVHVWLDQLSKKEIGTTGRGVGPAYEAKARRSGNLRIAEVLANPVKAAVIIAKEFKLAAEIAKLRGISFDARLFRLEENIEEFIAAVQELEKRGFIEKDILWVTSQVENGVNVLMEGAQAYGLDVSLAPVPYSTSSNTVAGNAFVGGDVSPKYRGKIIGVTKLIASKVGGGPFVGEFGGRASELYCAEEENGLPKYREEIEADLYNADEMLQSFDQMEFGKGLRMKTGEYGATTKRPRRIGEIDLFRMAAAARHLGLDELVLTKFDCLKYYLNNRLFQGKLPLITAYHSKGGQLGYVPVVADDLAEVRAGLEFVDIPLIDKDTRDFDDLTPEAQLLVDKIQRATKTRVTGLGIGRGRNDMVHL